MAFKRDLIFNFLFDFIEYNSKQDLKVITIAINIYSIMKKLQREIDKLKLPISVEVQLKFLEENKEEKENKK